jgi:hypothetical protein
LIILTLSGCNVKYNFTGTGKLNAKTFQVNYFQNNAAIVEPGIERTFTQQLQNTIQNQTNLNLVTANGDLLYEGEITDFRVSPASASADQTQGSSLNRLDIVINVRFSNKNKEDDNFEKRFTHFETFPANATVSSVLQKALDVIYNRITQDVFNESLAKW